MKLPKFGQDPMDIYSKPINQEKTKLATIFEMKPRDIVEKPGRSLFIVWDKRLSLVDGFENNYNYIITFGGKGKKAGDHYHKSKQELLAPIIGRVKITLKDIHNNETEEIFIDAKDHKILHVAPNVFHTITAESDICSVLVTATFPGNKADEFSY